MRIEGGARGRGADNTVREPGRPTVSVVTVVRNGASVVAQAIESVLAQDYPNVEYVVVDGLSTDGTIDVLRRYGSGIDYWVSEPDEGIADAFNKGIELTRGELVGILNADDRYEQGAIGRVVAAFEADPQLDVVCGALGFHRDGERLWASPSDPSGLRRGMTIQHPTTFVRRSRYARSGLFRADFQCAMDYELMLRFEAHGARFLALPAVIASMRLGGRSERQWLRASYEVARAQRLVGFPRGRVAFGYIRRLVDRALRVLLFGLGFPGGWRDLQRGETARGIRAGRRRGKQPGR